MIVNKMSNINLIIVCNDSKHNDDLTFLTWYSFNKHFSGIKSLILKNNRSSSNINYWSSSFKIHNKVFTSFCLEKLNEFDFLDDSYFVVKAGVIFSKPEINLENSFNLFDNYGIYYFNKNFPIVKNDIDYLMGYLEDDVSSIFIDLNPWIEKLNQLKLIDKLSLAYGEPDFLKGKGTSNQINFGSILKDAQKIYNNFPEVLNV